MFPRRLVRSGLLAILIATSVGAARVRVEDAATGDPLAGAAVRGATGEALADDGGWASLPDDLAATCVTAPGFVPLRPTSPIVDGDSLALARGASLSGRVVTPDGKPVAGVTLRVAGDEDLGPCARSAVSGAAGAYALDGLARGTIARIEVAPSDAVVPTRATLSLLVREAVPPRLDVVVLAAARGTVTVTGAEGRPLPGASVRVPSQWKRLGLPAEPDATVREAIDSFDGTTDAAGVVLLPALPRAAGWRVVVRHPKHAASALALDLREGAPSARIALKQGGSLVVRGIDEAGAPWTGLVARLIPSSAQDADLVPEPAPAGGDGAVRVDRVPAGRYEAEVRAPGARPRLRPGLVVKDATVTDVGDIMLEPGATLRGSVLGDGAPLAGAEVTLWSTADGAPLKVKTASGSDGGFAFEGLEPGVTADLRASAEGWIAQRRRDVATDASDALIELRRAAALIVDARDADTDEPLPDVDIRVADAGDQPERQDAERDEERPGEWRVDGLREGTKDVVVRAPGYAAEARRGVELASGEELRLRVELASGAVVEGRVVDAETAAGIALATVSVEAQGVDATSRADGSFTLDGVRAPFDVSARHDAYVTSRVAAVDPERLADRLLLLTLERGGSVEGTVYDGQGAIVAGAEVREAGRGRSTLSGADGRYRLDGLEAGSRGLTKVDRPGSFDGLEAATVDVVKGGVTRHDFGLGLRIAGTVTRSGEPTRGVRIAALSTSSDEGPRGMGHSMGAAVTGADGRYTVSVRLPGSYGLTVDWRGHRFSRIVTVAEGSTVTTEDIAIPDVHLAGRVVDASTREPIAGAYVTVSPKSRDEGGSYYSIGMAESDDEGNETSLHAWSFAQSEAQSAADGSYTVLVEHPGPVNVSSWMQGYEPWTAPDGFAVSSSRDDLVIEMKPKAAAHLRVSVTDATTGAPVPGTIIATISKVDEPQSGNVMTTSGSSTLVATAPAPGETATVLAWSEGRSIGVKSGILPSGEDITVQLALSPGGSVRLLVPDGALAPDRWRGVSGDLHVAIAEGLEIAGDALNVMMNVTSRIVSQVGPGEWLLRDLPVGPATFSLGDGTPRTVDVVAGEVVEVDLR